MGKGRRKNTQCGYHHHNPVGPSQRPASFWKNLEENKNVLNTYLEELDGDEYEEFSARAMSDLSCPELYVPEALDTIAEFCQGVSEVLFCCGTHERDRKQVHALSNILHTVMETFPVQEPDLTIEGRQRRRQNYTKIQQYCEEARDKIKRCIAQSNSNPLQGKRTRPEQEALPRIPKRQSITPSSDIGKPVKIANSQRSRKVVKRKITGQAQRKTFESGPNVKVQSRKSRTLSITPFPEESGHERHEDIQWNRNLEEDALSQSLHHRTSEFQPEIDGNLDSEEDADLRIQEKLRAFGVEPKPDVIMDAEGEEIGQEIMGTFKFDSKIDLRRRAEEVVDSVDQDIIEVSDVEPDINLIDQKPREVGASEIKPEVDAILITENKVDLIGQNLIEPSDFKPHISQAVYSWENKIVQERNGVSESESERDELESEEDKDLHVQRNIGTYEVKPELNLLTNDDEDRYSSPQAAIEASELDWRTDDEDQDSIGQGPVWFSHEDIVQWTKVEWTNPKKRQLQQEFSLKLPNSCFKSFTEALTTSCDDIEPKKFPVQLIAFVRKPKEGQGCGASSLVEDGTLLEDDPSFRVLMNKTHCSALKAFRSKFDLKKTSWVEVPKSSLNPVRNCLKIGVDSAHDLSTMYSLEVSLKSVVVYSLSEVKEVVMKYECSASRTQALVRNFLSQDKTKLTITDPTIHRIIKIPVRGDQCEHLECFDLETFLRRNTGPSDWICPMESCSSMCQPRSLEFDKWLADNLLVIRNEKRKTVSIDLSWSIFEGAVPIKPEDEENQ